MQDLWIEDCFNAVMLKTDDKRLSRAVTRRSVRATHRSPTAGSSQYGLQANTVRGLLVKDFHWEDAWLDGIRLWRAMT